MVSVILLFWELRVFWELGIEPRSEIGMAAFAGKIGWGLAGVAGVAWIGSMRKK